ncbi:20875_t:CDS:2, partial [Rhizophagus irregularis]
MKKILSQFQYYKSLIGIPVSMITIEILLKLGTHKNLDVEFHNKIWAEELWEAQKLIIDQQRKIEGVVFAILKYPTDFENSLSNKPLKTAFITMNKCKKYDVSLIKVGKLDEELHFGAFGRFWWKSRDNILYPIRLEMKTLVTLNKTHFIITVVKGTSVAAFQPGYICEANGITSSVYDTPSGAINFLYHILFNERIKLKYSGKNPVEVWKEVWKKIEVLQNWDGKTLFGINHEKTQNL